MNIKKPIITLLIVLVLLVTGTGNLWAIKLETNALVNGLVKMFPTLKDKKWPYIDFDKSGDNRTEPGVPEIIWDRPGDGEGSIQAQEILEAVVYKDNFRYLSVGQLQEIIKLLETVGKASGKGIMTEKVARSYTMELEGLLSRRKNLPDIVTQNERKRVSAELLKVIQRMSKQYTEEADKEASATFKGDLEKFKNGMEVVMKTEDNDPMKLPLDTLDSDERQVKANMVRILGDEVKNYNERYINNKTAIFSIGKIGGTSALNILVNILQDPKFSKELNNTINALGNIGKESTNEVVDKIGEYLENIDDIEVKATAIRTLGKLGNKKSIGLLQKYIDTPPLNMEQLRTDALKALVDIAEIERSKGIASAEIVPTFTSYAKDPNPMLASFSIKGLALVKNKIPYTEIWTLIKKMKDFPKTEIINNVLNTIELVSRYNPYTYKLYFSSGSESRSIFKYLQECFSGKYKGYFARHPRIRIRIARFTKEIIIQVPWLQGLETLVEAIVDKDPMVNEEIAKLLIQISYEYKTKAYAYGTSGRSIPAITFRTIKRKKDNPKLLEKGLQIISKQKIIHPQVADYFFPYLADLNERIVRQSIRGLRCILNEQLEGEKLYKPGQLELVRALIVKNTLPMDIRIAAIEVAGKIGYSDASSSGNNIIKALYEVLLDKNATNDIRIASILTFGKLREKKGRSDKLWIVVKDLIVKYIEDEDINIRKAVVQSFIEINVDSPEIRKALYFALAEEKNKPIYYNILDAIRILNNPKSSEPLRDFITKEKKIDPRVKKLAIIALGNCGDPDMIDILIDALKDQNTENEARRGLYQLDKDEMQKRIRQKIRVVTDEKIKKELEGLLRK